MAESPASTEERFITLLRRALLGWQAKVDRDFGEESIAFELESLRSDPVYSQFRLASHGYVLIRLMGRMSISIGRRIGELYDNLPKFVAAARFSLEPDEVSATVDRLKLDVCIPFDKLSTKDRDLAVDVTLASLGLDSLPLGTRGLGIEIRYNFNPNDSARLRKDVAMAAGLAHQNLLPIYLVYSGISPRADAIKRLGQAGWRFLIAEDASVFTNNLLGLDLKFLMESENVQREVRSSMDDLMSSIMTSAAMSAARKESETQTEAG